MYNRYSVSLDIDTKRRLTVGIRLNQLCRRRCNRQPPVCRRSDRTALAYSRFGFNRKRFVRRPLAFYSGKCGRTQRVSFPPNVQAINWHYAASIRHQSAHRTREGITAKNGHDYYWDSLSVRIFHTRAFHCLKNSLKRVFHKSANRFDLLENKFIFVEFYTNQWYIDVSIFFKVIFRLSLLDCKFLTVDQDNSTQFPILLIGSRGCQQCYWDITFEPICLNQPESWVGNYVISKKWVE